MNSLAATKLIFIYRHIKDKNWKFPKKILHASSSIFLTIVPLLILIASYAYSHDALISQTLFTFSLCVIIHLKKHLSKNGSSHFNKMYCITNSSGQLKIIAIGLLLSFVSSFVCCFFLRNYELNCLEDVLPLPKVLVHFNLTAIVFNSSYLLFLSLVTALQAVILFQYYFLSGLNRYFSKRRFDFLLIAILCADESLPLFNIKRENVFAGISLLISSLFINSLIVFSSRTRGVLVAAGLTFCKYLWCLIFLGCHITFNAIKVHLNEKLLSKQNYWNQFFEIIFMHLWRKTN